MNIRASVTEFTAVAVEQCFDLEIEEIEKIEDFEIKEHMLLTGNLCNPDDLEALAVFLKKWENNPKIMIDLYVD